ncbi:MAG: Heat-inducible transcription repressor HrcA [Candidatus Anoxychlamydiales bacterium]|nr:Heat-inducible transcription repressor HrcA [Candidatus Anoxychlamydiales bacterium]
MMILCIKTLWNVKLKKLFVKKRFTKENKELKILLGLVELFIETNAPIGSNSLKESGFDDMSSATIRNYFAQLEKKGLLTQPHISGGRVPTAKAFKIYANHCLSNTKIDKQDDLLLQKHLSEEKKQITEHLNSSLELLSTLTNLSIFQSAPRFDQDFINNIKLISLDTNKILCVIVTDFGLIKTEILYSKLDLDEKSLKLVEDFFLWRMNKKQKPNIENQNLFKASQHLYNEIMVRYIVGYTNLSTGDIYKTGLSKLLSYPEFKNPIVLAEALSIFENKEQMHKILNSAIKNDAITYFIADDLEKFGLKIKNTALICIPYYISNIAVGAIGILCPLRVDYKKIFSILKVFSKYLSDNLTKNIYKFKITFRKTSDYKKINQHSILLEDKSK